jgi:primosomal protein N' (replication factor Y)
VLRIAVDTPLMRVFDYLPPSDHPPLRPGQRVRVPFGRGDKIGVLIGLAAKSAVPREKLRHAHAILDAQPLLDDPLRALLDWTSSYYQHPVGEVYAAALPRLLRQGRDPSRPPPRWFAGPGADAQQLEQLGRRAPVQARILAAALAAQAGLSPSDLDIDAASFRRAVKALADKGLLEARETPPESVLTSAAPMPGPRLTEAQQSAVIAIRQQASFNAFLLDGVTGSGKTEVYLECIRAQIETDRQSLVLVPEIGLTPQLLQRFSRRLGVPVAVLHSGLTDAERLQAWTRAAQGEALVVIGTRSAIFTPLPRLGLIVVDEEHDASLKQQDGLRYSARDLAVWRARQLDLPVVLGSATPALESLENARAGRYTRLELPERPGSARQPEVKLVDLRRYPAVDGLSPPLLAAVGRHLEADGQVLLYLNRRGFAPVLMCTDCGQVLECRRCDARLVYHRQRGRLVCHHCGSERPAPRDCPGCGMVLQPVGQGTERLEATLRKSFPEHQIVRIDRDTTRRRGEIERRLEQVRSGEARLLLGTQMLTKGHDFPNVTLVGIVDADQGLFGTDFRSSERLAQSFVQVAGRAGRAERPGEVLIQTSFPDHPLLQILIRDGYHDFALAALDDRRAAGWPPFAYLALLRAEATRREFVFRFLDEARAQAGEQTGQLHLLGPAPAPMERRAGRYRGQLLIRAPQRAELQRFLQRWRTQLDELRSGRRVRWSLDVDPAELF